MRQLADKGMDSDSHNFLRPKNYQISATRHISHFPVKIINILRARQNGRHFADILCMKTSEFLSNANSLKYAP